MTTTMTNYVIEVTDQTFATEVIERSKSTPVVVDFWRNGVGLAGCWGQSWKSWLLSLAALLF